jgi:hypothetical protein
VIIVKLDVDVIITFLDWDIFNRTGSILVVCTVHFGLRRSFNSNTKTTSASISRFNCENVGFINDGLLQTVSIGLDLIGVAASDGSDWVGRVWKRRTIIAEVNFVISLLSWDVADLEWSFGFKSCHVGLNGVAIRT